jgi:cytochrome c2
MTLRQGLSLARPCVVRAVAMSLAVALSACGGARDSPAKGDAENGRLLLRQFGCGTCHRIPGVATADGAVGPSLDGVARRVYIGGFVPNTPDNMSRWIRNPQAFDPRTAMPRLQVGEAHARDMTAYLYTLR